MDHVGNLLRCADTVCWAETSNHFEHLLIFALEEEFGASRTWGDSVHANTLTHEIFGHDADHLLDSTFGGVIKEVARHDGGGLGEGGGHQNDMRSGSHVGESFLDQKVSMEGAQGSTKTHLNQEVWAFDVEFDNLVKVVLRGVLEILHGQDAGIGNEDVDFAKVLDRGIYHGLDSAETACIRLDSKGTVVANLFNKLIGRG